MKNELPDLTEGQIRCFEIFQKTRMAWLALSSTLFLFACALTALLWILFQPQISDPSRIVVGVINGVLGLCLRQVFGHLFPIPTKAPAKTPKKLSS